MDTFNVQFYADEDLAYQATKKAEIWGYVSFHANFSEAFFGRIWNQIDSDKKTRKESTTEVSFIFLKVSKNRKGSSEVFIYTKNKQNIFLISALKKSQY